MAAAFQSPKVDDYFDRLKDLDHKVVPRYGFRDPYEAVGADWYGPPLYGYLETSQYAGLLLETGDKLEAQDDDAGAAQEYFAVARFIEEFRPPGMYFLASKNLDGAYGRLEKLSEKRGDKQQAELYAELDANIHRDGAEWFTSRRQRFDSGTVTRWDATVVRISGLLMLVSFALMLIGVVGTIGNARSLRMSELRAHRAGITVSAAGAIALLCSSLTLSVSYRPYGEIFKNFLLTGDDSHMTNFWQFLYFTEVPPGVGSSYGMEFAYRFWIAVIALCAIALVFVALKFLRHYLRPNLAT
ncbi:MAG: hypothetical protein WBF35_08535 [Candidatus Acidiferrales bacterium]